MKKNWNETIHMSKLYKQLGFIAHKIPADHSAVHEDYSVPLRSGESRTLTISIEAQNRSTTKNRPHRIFVLCPSCGANLPAGRLQQHEGSKVCQRTEKQLAEHNALTYEEFPKTNSWETSDYGDPPHPGDNEPMLVASNGLPATPAAVEWAEKNNSTWIPECAPEEAKVNYRELTPEEAREEMKFARVHSHETPTE